MGIVRNANPTSAYEKELARWDLKTTEYLEDDNGQRLYGYNAAGYQPFPKMVYKAHRRENGKVMCMDMDALYAADANVQLRAEAFNASCMKIVGNQAELDRAREEGWRGSPKDALEHHEALQQDIAKAAAETNWGVQRMSDKAQREHAAADAATDAPITDVPVRKTRGRKAGQPMVTVS